MKSLRLILALCVILFSVVACSAAQPTQPQSSSPIPIKSTATPIAPTSMPAQEGAPVDPEEINEGVTAQANEAEPSISADKDVVKEDGAEEEGIESTSELEAEAAAAELAAEQAVEAASQPVDLSTINHEQQAIALSNIKQMIKDRAAKESADNVPISERTALAIEYMFSVKGQKS